MALLQIAEPGQSAAPHQYKFAIGIDLGTTYSLVATVMSGESRVLKDSSDNFSYPSVVHYTNEKVLSGNEALSYAVLDPENTIVSVKRFIGLNVTDVRNRYPKLPYEIKESENGLPLFVTKGGTFNPIQVSAEILKPLVKLAEESTGNSIYGAVITVPAYFNDTQRQATKDAANLIGLKVLRLLNEPTAAAIAYGLDSKEDGIIAVYDLGGGTFDLSLLRLSKGIFEVLATNGDTALGGDDFDHAIVSILIDVLKLDINNISKQLRRQLDKEARRVKESLSTSDSVIAKIVIDEKEISHEITVNEFNEAILGLVKTSIKCCKLALKDADINIEDIDAVVMVGGSTRVPIVKKMVHEFFSQEPLTSIDPDKVVALGAAIQADILAGNRPDSELLLLDVLPLSLGVETMGGLVEKVIPRNTSIPVTRAQEFTTYKDGQTAMSFNIVQGERELVSDCRALAKFNLSDIPPLAAGAAHIRVSFQVDADGILSVEAMEKGSGARASIQVKPSFGLTDEEVMKMLQESMVYAKDDINKRMLLEEKVEGMRVLESLNAALKQDKSLLGQDELEIILSHMSLLESAIEKEDIKLIKNAIELLDSKTQNFASLRMDNSIKKALTGKSIDKI